jgi:F-type H+-transporting ATPase subunit epsilon
MSDNFKLEVISPNKTIFNSDVKQVTIPAFEGLMTILKDHISLVTFLRPGFIEIDTNNKEVKFFVEEGTVEFSKNNLLILSSTVKNKKDFKNEDVEKLIEEYKSEINSVNIRDKEKYILSYKIEALQELK